MENRVMTPEQKDSSGISWGEAALLGGLGREGPWQSSPTTNYAQPDLNLGEPENERTAVGHRLRAGVTVAEPRKQPRTERGNQMKAIRMETINNRDILCDRHKTSSFLEATLKKKL